MLFTDHEGARGVPNPFSCTKKLAIERFRTALLGVAPDYFSVELPNNTQAHQERVFAYELYHQLRNQFDANWYVHGEFRKGLSMVPRIDSNRWVIPDLVVHESASLEKNLVAVEIKSSAKTNAQDLVDDLEKLEIFTNPQGLGFLVGILLVVNVDVRDVIQQASENVKAKIIRMLETGPRTAIWNIASPRAKEADGKGQLESSSLNILRANEVRSCANRRRLTDAGYRSRQVDLP